MVHPIDSQLVFNSVLGGLVPLGVTGGLMEHSFSGKIPFNSNDTENLLNPRFVFVGAHWVDKDGNFSTLVDLQKGLNLIKITAKKRYSRISEAEIRVLFNE